MKKLGRTCRLLLASVAVGAVWYAPAMAQDSDAQDAAETTEASGRLGEIVVTAQRRSENLQQVPLSVTAANAEELAAKRIDSVMAIAQITPSVSFDKTSSNATSSNIIMRGIGTIGLSRAFEGAVGVVVDGVYRSRPGQMVQNWLDFESVQVLRGPQGTLFGKNTTAGALLFTSTAPSLSDVEGSYELTAGDYTRGLARGAVNVPVSDKLAIRAAGMWSNQRGYLENPVTGDRYGGSESKAIKLQALWEPTDSLSVRIIADWARQDSVCCHGTVVFAPGPTTPIVQALVAPTVFPPTSDWRDYKTLINQPPVLRDTDRGIVAHLAWDTGAGELKYVGSYRKWDDRGRDRDGDYGPADILNIVEAFGTESYSSELTYSGQTDFLSSDYLVGVYFANEDIRATRQFSWGVNAYAYWNGRLGASINPTQYEADPGVWKSEVYRGENKSFGAFTHWIMQPSDQFKIVTGLRYTREAKNGSFRDIFNRGSFRPGPPPYPITYVAGLLPGPAYDSRNVDEALSGTAALQYTPSRDVMLYASYSRGFKAGGVNLDANAAGGTNNNPAIVPFSGASVPPLDPRYKKETADAFEAGLKSTFLDGRARVNVAGFYTKLKNLQVARFLGTRFEVINAPKALVYGAEVESNFALAEGVTLDASATWLPKADFGVDPILAANSGRRLAQAPKLTATGGINVDRPISDATNLTARVNLRYRSGIFTTAADNIFQPSLTLVDASLGLRFPDAGLRVEVWCQNCTDRRYVTQTFTATFQAQTQAYVGAPRSVGFTLRGEF